MDIIAWTPSPILRPFIKTFLIIESQECLINRILPDTSPVIAFRYKGAVNDVNDGLNTPLASSVISGLRKSPRLINYEKNSGNLLVVFKEATAAFFFKESLHELFEASVPLDNFFSKQKIALLEEQLAEAADHSQRIMWVEQFLASHLSFIKHDGIVSTAIKKIHLTNGIVKVKELANELCVSQDAFEKRFRKAAGTSPKQFSSIVRMKTLIAQKRQDQIFTDVALEGGFFDQAHFNKEFKIFTGQSPAEFFKSRALW